LASSGIEANREQYVKFVEYRG